MSLTVLLIKRLGGISVMAAFDFLRNAQGWIMESVSEDV